MTVNGELIPGFLLVGFGQQLAQILEMESLIHVRSRECSKVQLNGRLKTA